MSEDEGPGVSLGQVAEYKLGVGEVRLDFRGISGKGGLLETN